MFDNPYIGWTSRRQLRYFMAKTADIEAPNPGEIAVIFAVTYQKRNAINLYFLNTYIISMSDPGPPPPMPNC